jgi:serine/threonine protein kinase
MRVQLTGSRTMQKTKTKEIPMNTTHYELPSGTLLHNRYRIESVIGQGGFGITYKAIDESLKRPVCIKELFLSGHCTRGSANTVHSQGLKELDFTHFCERFVEEAGALARFRHPGIVQVQDVFRENGTAYNVMEFVEGETLKARTQKSGPITLEIALPLMQGLLDAVEEIHRQGMLHRDIKPDNVMLRPNGQPVLIDFGSARAFNDAKTVSQTAILTPGYAPLEQYSEKARRGPYTDIYSLGATFYFLLTGKAPLSPTDRQLTDEMPAPHHLIPEIPSTLSSAIMLALNVRPEDRFQQVDEFRQSLHTAIAGNKTEGALMENMDSMIVVQPSPISNKGRNRFLLLAAVLLITGWLLYRFVPGSISKEDLSAIHNHDSDISSNTYSDSINKDQISPDSNYRRGKDKKVNQQLPNVQSDTGGEIARNSPDLPPINQRDNESYLIGGHSFRGTRPSIGNRTLACMGEGDIKVQIKIDCSGRVNEIQDTDVRGSTYSAEDQDEVARTLIRNLRFTSLPEYDCPQVGIITFKLQRLN